MHASARFRCTTTWIQSCACEAGNIRFANVTFGVFVGVNVHSIILFFTADTRMPVAAIVGFPSSAEAVLVSRGSVGIAHIAFAVCIRVAVALHIGSLAANASIPVIGSVECPCAAEAVLMIGKGDASTANVAFAVDIVIAVSGNIALLTASAFIPVNIVIGLPNRAELMGMGGAGGLRRHGGWGRGDCGGGRLRDCGRGYSLGTAWKGPGGGVVELGLPGGNGSPIKTTCHQCQHQERADRLGGYGSHSYTPFQK